MSLKVSIDSWGIFYYIYSDSLLQKETIRYVRKKRRTSNKPVKPAWHWQWYWATPSKQIPPFLQGDELHSSKFVSQWRPRNPGWQLHKYSLSPSRQVPPFWQVTCKQSSILCSHNVPENRRNNSCEWKIKPFLTKQKRPLQFWGRGGTGELGWWESCQETHYTLCQKVRSTDAKTHSPCTMLPSQGIMYSRSFFFVLGQFLTLVWTIGILKNYDNFCSDILTSLL